MKFTQLDKRIWTKGLALECPLGKAVDDCPLNALRHLPVSQMNSAINGLSDEQVDSIVMIHHTCYQDRLKAMKRPKS